ncbi:hypothetical protein PEL8287_00842 [Roseovarius litorisediminis]|uniref:Uncharacterized protein n=1 Tax=Roseovarius litorisediminis TaxID=1312363 RepID=A0A1Y5RLR5_9RHOB|nr:hypothetical protein PEL8287_00842 [Roseovarius litorisediminis]
MRHIRRGAHETYKNVQIGAVRAVVSAVVNWLRGEVL